MVFNKSGHLFSKLKFKIGETQLKVVKEYTYLGITFSISGSFKKAILDLRDKARRAYFKFRRHNLTNNPILTIKLFDVLVKPILAYCCEVWCITENRNVCSNNLVNAADNTYYEFLNLSMCKYLLGVRRNTSNIASRGELGRYPLMLDFIMHSLKYKKRISQLEGSLVHDAYIDDLKLEKSWAKSLDNLHKNLNLTENFNLRDLQKHYSDCWIAELQKSTKLCSLALAKSTFSIEKYVTTLPFTDRRDFARLRTSSHTLEIEVGRYNRPKVDRELRTCKLCKSGLVEDERHFLLNCSYFKEERELHAEIFTKNLPLILEDTPDCFKALFSCSNGSLAACKAVCKLAKSLSALRFEYSSSCPQIFRRPTTVVTQFAGGGGRIIRPPDRLTYY